MATTYAALVSLMNLLTRYQHPTCPVSFNQSQLHSLLNKVSSLVHFLEAYSGTISKDLLTKMAGAAFVAEDTIESYYVDQVLERSGGNSHVVYDHVCYNLEKEMHAINLIIQEAEVSNGDMYERPWKKRKQEKDGLSIAAMSTGPVLSANGMVKMVGLDEEFDHLRDQITSYHRNRQIIAVVGMGGIGKTTLARNLYEHPYVKRRFDVLSWVTVSQQYTVGRIMNSLLSNTHDDDTQTNEELGDQLYKYLWGRKYLIVLDDIWEGLAWDEIRRFFPDNNNGSRILLTTRISHVAVSIGSCAPHEVKLLDERKSWDLLCETVFRQEECPYELIKSGEKIAKGCKGLPLAITVIGGMLRISEKTLDFWENVAENVKSFMSAEREGHCLRILSLSYNHLPIHLKPCILYMATLGEDKEVTVSTLMELWIGEGFLKPQNDRKTTLEDAALKYLNHLIDRNLIMVVERAITGEIMKCSLHDLLREFCLMEAWNEQFLYHVSKDAFDVAERLESIRRLVLQSNKCKVSTMLSVPFARSFTYLSDTSGRDTEFPLDILDWTFCRLLRVFNTYSIVDLDVDIRHLLNLRYLACKVKEITDMSRFFSWLSLSWNLETLVIHTEKRIVLPSEFWELPNLRLVSCPSAFVRLEDPIDDRNCCALANLRSIIGIRKFNVTDAVIRKVSELKTLKVEYEYECCSNISYYFANLARLHRLESLICSFDLYWQNKTCVFNEPMNLTLSPNLRELTLDGTFCIPWEYMTIIGSLPKLEDLVLQSNAFFGEEWESTEGHFQCLKRLRIEGCSVRTWRAESSHFPRLEDLKLHKLNLEEIPLGTAELPSLQSISLWTSKKSAVVSAKEILDEKQNQGDDDLFIKVRYKWKPDDESELDTLVSDNFLIEHWGKPNSHRYVE